MSILPTLLVVDDEVRSLATLLQIAPGDMTITELDDLNRPRSYADQPVHHGCPRNAYYEHKASALAQAQGTPGALEQALLNAPVREGDKDPVTVQHIVRTFDPCMVCAVH